MVSERETIGLGGRKVELAALTLKRVMKAVLNRAVTEISSSDLIMETVRGEEQRLICMSSP